MSTPNTPNEPTNVRQPTIMLSDLTGDLLWPKVMRAPALALSPSRLIAGSVCAFLLMLVIEIGTSIKPISDQFQSVTESFSQIIAAFSDSVLDFEPVWFIRSIWLFALTCRDTLFYSPLTSLALGLPLIAVLAIGGGAIARSTAFEFSQGRFASSEDTLGFALKRARQFTLAVVGPLVFCALIFLIIAIGGLSLSVPVIDLLGAFFYGLALILGALATFVLVLHLVALPMIVPALAVEGTDAFDAIQRSYAYVIGKPLRYISYALLLTALASLAITVFSTLVLGAIEMTDWAAEFFATDPTNRALTGLGEMGATKGIAHTIITIWRTLLELLIAGYAISLFFTSSTLLYLVTRRICDGQDINEVWNGIGE